MQIQYSVTHQELERQDSNKVVENSVDYLQIKFTFTEDWNNTTKIAFFTYGSETYSEVIGEDGTCYVPVEANKYPGFSFSLIGYGNGTTQKIPTNSSNVGVCRTFNDNNGEYKSPSIRKVKSNTLEVDGYLDEVFLEIPNIYGAKLSYNKENGKLELLGRVDGDTEKVLSVVDLPSEEHIKDVNYDNVNQIITITWQNDQTTEIDLSALMNTYSADEKTITVNKSGVFSVKKEFVSKLVGYAVIED